MKAEKAGQVRGEEREKGKGEGKVEWSMGNGKDK